MAENKFKMVGKTLSVTSVNLDECIDYINKNDIKSIYVCSLFYQDDNLNFLGKCPNVREININSIRINNVNGLYSLNYLSHLILQDINCKVDMSKFEQLESFSGTWNENYENLDRQNKLKKLNLSSYRPKSKNLNELGLFGKLEILELVSSSIESLYRIEQFSNLKSLGLYSCRKIKSIKELKFSENIKELRIEGCKNIEDYNSLENAKSLHKISIFDCGCIDNIRFIDSLNLDYFACLKTKILDDSFTPKKRIAYCEIE